MANTQHTGTTPLVSARGLTKSFGGVTANNAIDIDVFPGEIVGIMGPNGAGKSTFLSMISGNVRPTSGSLEVGGHDFTKIAPGQAARLGVGLAHQIPKPFKRLTVRQNIEIASHLLPIGKRHDAVERALETSGMTDRADSMASSLGLLELKRLEVARVLALNPDLVLLDEVAAGLNGADLDNLIDLIKRVRDDGKTIVVVEHVQEVFQQLADRIVVLEWGEKLTEGTPAEVAKDPRVIEIYLGGASNEENLKGDRIKVADNTLLSATNLVSGYGPIQVLRDVSFDLHEGHILGVLGANGAGKSTLAKTLQGLVPITSGTLSYEGKEISSLKSFERQRNGIALVPEGRRLFADLSVEENLKLGLRSERSLTDHDESPLDKVYELFPKLVELQNRRAGALSGGEQQMVAIGRALASQPRVVIFDELSLGLAPVIVDRLLEAVVQIANWGTSVILIEQNVHKAAAVSDHLLVMRQGKVVFAGLPGDLSEEELQHAYLGDD